MKYFENSIFSSSILLTPPYFLGIWDIFMTFFILKKCSFAKIFVEYSVLWFSYLFTPPFYIFPIRAANTWFYLFTLKNVPIGAADTCFYFFPPSPIGASDTGCVPLFPKPLAHRGLGYLLKKNFFLKIIIVHRGFGYLLYFFFSPIGATDTCLDFFFNRSKFCYFLWFVILSAMSTSFCC